MHDVAAVAGALVIRSGGNRTGQSFPLQGDRMVIGRSPEAEVFLDDVTVSRDHAVLVRRSGAWFLDDSGSLNGTYVNRRRVDSHKLGRRRRAADRQVQADVPGAVTELAEHEREQVEARGPARRRRDPPTSPRPQGSGKSLTIGAVCKALSQEFEDISISKIRYLEDQKLLTPRRTPGGYRLYSAADVSRLRTILRLQRDEFLPLRVIRQELAAGRSDADPAAPRRRRRTAPRPAAAGGAAGRRAAPAHLLDRRSAARMYSLEDVVEDTGADPRLVAELEDFGIIQGDARDGTKFYDEAEREIVRAVTELSRYGVAGRNLRVFKTSAERESALLQQILSPGLRSRNPERRREAVEALENLAAVASHLKHLLLVRDLRRIAR